MVTVWDCPSAVISTITASRLRPVTTPFWTLSPLRSTKLLPRTSSAMANWSSAPHTMPTTFRPPTSGGASPPTSSPTKSPDTSDWNGSRRPSALYWYVVCSSRCAICGDIFGASEVTAVTTGAPAPSLAARRVFGFAAAFTAAFGALPFAGTTEAAAGIDTVLLDGSGFGPIFAAGACTTATGAGAGDVVEADAVGAAWCGAALTFETTAFSAAFEADCIAVRTP